MKPNEIKEIPHVDEDGYYDGMVACMADARGALMLGAATLKSSLGFEADSDSRANQDVNGLVTAAEAMAAAETAETKLTFMDANNEGHQVGLAELKTLQLEIIQAGKAAYQEKWKLRAAIEAATTKEELDAIEIVFQPLDFSKAA